MQLLVTMMIRCDGCLFLVLSRVDVYIVMHRGDQHRKLWSRGMSAIKQWFVCTNRGDKQSSQSPMHTEECCWHACPCSDRHCFPHVATDLLNHSNASGSRLWLGLAYNPASPVQRLNQEPIAKILGQTSLDTLRSNYFSR